MGSIPDSGVVYVFFGSCRPGGRSFEGEDARWEGAIVFVTSGGQLKYNGDLRGVGWGVIQKQRL